MNSYNDWKDYNFFLFMMIMELARTEGNGSALFAAFVVGFVVLAWVDCIARIRSRKKANN